MRERASEIERMTSNGPPFESPLGLNYGGETLTEKCMESSTWACTF